MDPGAPDVFVVGQACLDFLVLASEFPAPDTKLECPELARCGGGPGATAAVALARWGWSCHLAGVVGDDEFGGNIRDELASAGVDVRGLRTRAGCPSQVALVVAEPATGRRTIFWRRPGGAPLSPDELELDVLGRSRLLYTDGLHGLASLEAATLARSRGIPVVVDAGSLRSGSLELAGLADVFVVSSRFAAALLAVEEPLGPGQAEEACHRLADLGPRLVGVTLGARGWVAQEDGCLQRGAAHPAVVVDTTGCGDVFHAGLAHGQLSGWETGQSFGLAGWAAARVAERLGGRAGIPDRPSMERSTRP